VYLNIIRKISAELDLRRQQVVLEAYDQKTPEVVIEAAAKNLIEKGYFKKKCIVLWTTNQIANPTN